MKIDICYTPEVVRLFNFKGKNVVVVDIFRATSTMVTALANGLEKVIPVSNLEDCQSYPQDKNIIKAAERGGQKVEGFDYGNSPFDYTDGSAEGKTLIMTTTNGTRAINLSKEADNVIIGSFLNISAVANFLLKDGKDTVIFCAGWKGTFNLEDSLFAGALMHRLSKEYKMDSDGALAACLLYEKAKFDGFKVFLQNSSHYKRLAGFNNEKDIDWCLSFDEYEVLPVLKDGAIVATIIRERI